MWNRVELKQQAKENFKRTYGLSVVMALIAAIVSGAISIVVNVNNGGASTSSLLDIVLKVFLFAPAFVGTRYYFIKNSRQQEGLFDDLFFAFRNGNYGNVVLTMFLKSLYIALWSLLLIIPGIVKSYSYFMVDYILAENPTIDNKRAFEISKATMNGEKMNAFVLDLSFILWYIGTALTAGILGIVYVFPYIDATKANLYKVLREKALAEGYATSEDLPGIYENY